MMRKFIVLCLLTWSACSFSQYSLTGTVRDEEGQPLVGANVFFLDTQLGTITDIDGIFNFEKLNAGTYTLKIAYLGYQDQIRSISLTGNQLLDAMLSPANYLADAVIVYGTRANNRYPMAYSTITKDELQNLNTGNDITYMLAQTPSLVATSEAGIGIGYTAMRIRGTDPTRINVTLNGIPVNDAESQSVFWVDMPDLSASVKDVQIQRGVGTSSQGAGAFGATVNFQTLGLSPMAYADYQLLGGSFNTLRNSLSVGSGLLNDHFSIDARLSKLNSDGYIRHSGSDDASVYLNGAYHSQNSLLRFTFLDGHEHTGISWWGVPQEMLETDRRYNPAGIYYDSKGIEHYYVDQTDNYHQTHYQLLFSQKLSGIFNLNLAAHYTRGNGYYEQFMDDSNSYHTTAFSSYGLPAMMVINEDTLTQSDLVQRKWIDNDFYGFIGSVVFKKSRLEVIIGGGWNAYRGNHFGRIIWMENNNGTGKDYEWYRNTGDKDDLNLYAKVSCTISKKASVFGDIQYRNIRYSMNGIDDDLVDLSQEQTFHFFNPKLGLFYEINSHNKAYVSYAIANREPARADFKEAKGDPSSTPKPERLYDLELGYTISGTRYSVGANLYYMSYKDQLVPTGEKSNVGYSIMTNVEKSFRRGIELIATYKPFSFLKWDVNLTFSQNRIENFVEYATHYTQWNDDWQWYGDEAIVAKALGTTDIAYSPAVMGASTVEFEVIKYGTIALLSKYVGLQYFDNTSNSNRTIDPYFVNDIRLAYTIPMKRIRQLGLMLQINNLFNLEYSSNAYGGNWYENEKELTWAYYYPQAGIHFFGSLTINF
jgi:iron complex outermembrane receptor protein